MNITELAKEFSRSGVKEIGTFTQIDGLGELPCVVTASSSVWNAQFTLSKKQTIIIPKQYLSAEGLLKKDIRYFYLLAPIFATDRSGIFKLDYLEDGTEVIEAECRLDDVGVVYTTLVVKKLAHEVGDNSSDVEYLDVKVPGTLLTGKQHGNLFAKKLLHELGEYHGDYNFRFKADVSPGTGNEHCLLTSSFLLGFITRIPNCRLDVSDATIQDISIQELEKARTRLATEKGSN